MLIIELQVSSKLNNNNIYGHLLDWIGRCWCWCCCHLNELSNIDNEFWDGQGSADVFACCCCCCWHRLQRDEGPFKRYELSFKHKTHWDQPETTFRATILVQASNCVEQICFKSKQIFLAWSKEMSLHQFGIRIGFYVCMMDAATLQVNLQHQLHPFYQFACKNMQFMYSLQIAIEPPRKRPWFEQLPLLANKTRIEIELSNSIIIIIIIIPIAFRISHFGSLGQSILG